MKDTLVSVAEAAIAEGLTEFLLVGGHAVIFFGIPRFTEDVDFLIPARDHLAWRDFLDRLGYWFGHGTRGFEQFFCSGEGIPRIDLMLVGDDTWEKLYASATKENLTDNLALWLPAPEHLIAMKLQAATNETRSKSEQDWSDVVELIKRCKLDFDDESFRELIRRYGGGGAIKKIGDRLRRQPRERPDEIELETQDPKKDSHENH